MNDDEFRALQQEQEEVRQLAEATEEARAAGPDPDHIMAESRKGYEGLMKTKLKILGTEKVIKGNSILLKGGIYSERLGMINALRNATKKAKGVAL